MVTKVAAGAGVSELDGSGGDDDAGGFLSSSPLEWKTGRGRDFRSGVDGGGSLLMMEYY